MTVIDHVAVEVADIEATVVRFQKVYGLELIRWGTRYSTGLPIAMLSDANGFKIEVIQAGDGEADHDLKTPRMDHLAVRVDDVDRAVTSLQQADSEVVKPTHRLEAAKAHSALLRDPDGLKIQTVRYDADSPDLTQ